MKANELRIGNFVYSTFPKTEHIITGFCIQFLHEGGDPYVFEPIPLTEEWLLKFGFEFSDPFQWWYFKDHNITIDKGGESEFECFCYPIKSVHQLQNLYFSLTGTELKLKL